MRFGAPVGPGPRTRAVEARRRVTIDRFQNSSSHSGFWSTSASPMYSVGFRACRRRPSGTVAERRRRQCARSSCSGRGGDLAGEVPADDPRRAADGEHDAGERSGRRRSAARAARAIAAERRSRAAPSGRSPASRRGSGSPAGGSRSRARRVQLDAHLVRVLRRRGRARRRRGTARTRRAGERPRVHAAPSSDERRADEAGAGRCR